MTNVTCLSSNEGEHGFALGVLLAELLFVVLVLLDRPDPHLSCANGGEQRASRVQREHCECSPSEELEEIVGARDQLEAETARDLSDFGTSGAEILQNDVSVAVGELGKNHNSRGRVDERGVVLNGTSYRGSREPRRVDERRQEEAREKPVVSRVLENIEEWHSSVAESMNEKRLEFTLDVVSNSERDSYGLHLGRHEVALPDLGTKIVEERMDQDGPSVFSEEDGSPSNLRTEVLDVERLTCRDA